MLHSSSKFPTVSAILVEEGTDESSQFGQASAPKWDAPPQKKGLVNLFSFFPHTLSGKCFILFYFVFLLTKFAQKYSYFAVQDI